MKTSIKCNSIFGGLFYKETKNDSISIFFPSFLIHMENETITLKNKTVFFNRDHFSNTQEVRL